MIDKKQLEIAFGLAIENLVDSAALEPPSYPQKVINELVRVVLSIEEGDDPYGDGDYWEDYGEDEYEDYGKTADDEFSPDWEDFLGKKEYDN